MNDKIYFSFDPRPDITAFELWTCSQAGRLPQHMQKLQPEMLRHFRCIYDPQDRDAAAIASWFEHAAKQDVRILPFSQTEPKREG